VRQQLAVWTAILCLAVVTLLAFRVARALNPGEGMPRTAEPPRSVEAQAAQRGRLIYVESGCPTCHSVAGVGNPRNPLDGVSARLDEDRIRAWIVGAGALADSLPPSAARRKRGYRALPGEDLEALVAYLLGLPGR